MTGAAVLREEGLTAGDIAAPGPEVVVEPADLGQFLLRRARLHAAPVLADDGVNPRVAEQSEEPDLFNAALAELFLAAEHGRWMAHEE